MNVLFVYSDRWTTLAKELESIAGKPGYRFHFRRAYHGFDSKQYGMTFILGYTELTHLHNTGMTNAISLPSRYIEILDDISQYMDVSQKKRYRHMAKKLFDSLNLK